MAKEDWKSQKMYSLIKWSNKRLRIALEMEAIFGLLVKNLKQYWLQGKCLPNETNSSHKERLQGKIYYYLFCWECCFPEQKLFFLTLIKLFSDIWFYFFLQMFDLCTDVRCSYKPCSWDTRPVKATGLLWRPQWS